MGAFPKLIPLEELIPVMPTDVADADLSSNTYQIKASEFNIYATLTVNADTIFYLPPLSDTIGHIFTVYCVAVDGGNKITVSRNSRDDAAVFTDTDLSAAAKYISLYNTGLSWYTIDLST